MFNSKSQSININDKNKNKVHVIIVQEESWIILNWWNNWRRGKELSIISMIERKERKCHAPRKCHAVILGLWFFCKKQYAALRWFLLVNFAPFPVFTDIFSNKILFITFQKQYKDHLMMVNTKISDAFKLFYINGNVDATILSFFFVTMKMAYVIVRDKYLHIWKSCSSVRDGSPR